ncbi:MAG: hypothetical protein IPI81_05665 [Flavobacteriales bacterium]|nr:hypothetical protein [Flavobacteriales bacterium]
MIGRLLAHLRTNDGRNQVITFAAEGLSMVGMVLAYRLVALVDKEYLDLYVVVRRSVSFIYPLLMVGAAVGLMRFVAMARKPERQRAYLFGTFRWVIPLGAVLTLIGVIWSGPIAWLIFGDDIGVDLVPPLGLMIAAISIHGTVYSYLRGKGSMLVANGIQVFALAVVPCVTIIAFRDLSMVLWATGIAWLVVPLIAVLPDLLRPREGSSRKERAELLRYGLPRLPGDLALGALLTVPVYVVARTHGLDASGEIGFGTTLLNFTAAMFSPVALLLLPASAAQLASGDHKGLSARIGKLERLMFLASLALMLVFELSADLLLGLYLGPAGAEYVLMCRVIFLGALPFGIFIGLRSVLDAYYHTPRNGINLLKAFLILLFGSFLHFSIPSPPFAVGVALVVALYYLGWTTWRNVRFVRSELDRLATEGDTALRLVVVIPAEEKSGHYPDSHRQAEAMAERHGVKVTYFYLEDRVRLWKLIRDRQRFKRLLLRERPDLVSAHFGSVSAMFTVLSSSLPVAVTFLGSDLLRTKEIAMRRRVLGRWFSQFAAFFSAGIICDREELRERLWWRYDEARVLPVADVGSVEETYRYLRSLTFRSA